MEIVISYTTGESCPSNFNATIIVVDENDNQPRAADFERELQVEENANPEGLVVLEFIDLDVGPLYGRIMVISIEPTSAPFEVVNGSLWPTRSFNAEEDPEKYRISVTAIDGGGIASFPVSILIHIQDQNEFIPAFDQLVYQVDVSEGAMIGEIVHMFAAVDSDKSRQYRTVLYKQLTNISSFLVNETSGLVSVNQVLDYEVPPIQYVLLVQATDGGGLTNMAELRISVTDENEHSPALDKNRYTVNLLEGTPANASIVKLIATDNDGGPLFGSISQFNIVSLTSVPFSVDSEGNLHPQRTLNYDTDLKMYRFQVEAIDGGGRKSRLSEVIINLVNVNNQPPTWPDDAQTNVIIVENTMYSSPILSLMATDKDGNISSLTYYMQMPNALFQLQPDGNLYLTTDVDAEEQNYYKLEFVASDGIFNSTVLQVTVNVTNLNDNLPVFEQIYYEVNISENLLPNEFRLTLRASDADSLGDRGQSAGTSGIAQYNLQPSTNLFTIEVDIDTTFGVITNSMMPDFEAGCLYNFTVVAFDEDGRQSITPAIVVIHINDVNEFAPMFSSRQFYFELNEGTNFSEVISVRDKDLEGVCLNTDTNLVTGIISSGSEFRISSGNVLSNTRALRFDHGDTLFNITLQASDGELTSESNVVIQILDVNNFAPVFDSVLYQGTVEEMASFGTVVVLVSATDGDAGPVFGRIYRYELDNSSIPFEINPDGEVRLNGQVDFESGPRLYTFKVHAFDGGNKSSLVSSTIQITVINSNDHPPSFVRTNYRFTLKEYNNASGIVLKPEDLLVGTLNVEDPDGVVLFEFSFTPAHHPFRISPDGKIFFTRYPDHEIEDRYILTVRVSDGHYTADSTARVRIVVTNVNEFIPSAEHSYHMIHENSVIPRGSIRVMATDQDSGDFGEFTLRIMNHRELFNIDKTGNIVNKFPFDYESGPTIYVLRVRIRDGGGLETIVNVTIEILDVNEFFPDFDIIENNVVILDGRKAKLANIRENEAGLVTVLIARDRDGSEVYGSVAYELKVPSNSFSINSSTGHLLNIVAYDYENINDVSHNITVKAKDGGGNVAEILVIITVLDQNEFSPMFGEDSYSLCINETTPTETVILAFTVSDGDRGDSFGMIKSVTILSDDDNIPFSIQNTLQLVVTGELNYNTKIEYTFNAMAEDGGGRRSEPVSVTVCITDVNNNPPTFTQSLYTISVTESIANLSMPLLQLDVEDQDTNTSISFILVDSFLDLFEVDINEGNLWLLQPLDYEIRQQYVLHVIAFDGIFNSSEATITINVSPINEHAPSFTRRYIEMFLIENQLPGSLMVTVEATDDDKNGNGVLHGTIIQYIMSPEIYPFEISYDNETQLGTITNTEPVDFESDPNEYNLTVIALDGGRRQSLIPAIVRIVIVDENDEIPRFSMPLYEFYLSENVIEEFLISATDNDVSSAFNTLSYSIEDDSVPFVALPNGTLKNVRPLDFEQQPDFYTFNITVSDPDSFTGQSQVTVYLQDVNEFTPNFTVPINVYVEENLPVNHSVLEILVTDLDRGEFGTIESVTLDGSGGRFFVSKLTVNMYAILLSGPLNYETFTVSPPVWNVSLEACDRGGLCFMKLFTIILTDVNEFIPEFDTTIASSPIRITEETDPSVNNPILIINAIDFDGSDRNLIFSLANSTYDAFVVSENGRVLLERPLDFEETLDITVALYVQVTDGEFFAKEPFLVLISVININDNNPIVQQPPVITITENDFPVFPLYVFNVTDPDGLTSTFHFVPSPSFVELQELLLITSDGELRLKKPLDYENSEQQVITFQLQVNDSVLLSEPVTVTINVIPVNDHSPSFVQSMYSADIQENTIPGTLTLTIVASDSDQVPVYNGSTHAEVVDYEIVDDNVPFSVSFNNISGEGIITNTMVFDAESDATHYQFNVLAYDGEGSVTNIPAMVFINITDQNDHTPVFSLSSYTFYILENSNNDTMQVSASDNDISMLNSALSYSISPNENFTIDSNGVITSLTTFDYESDSHLYLLTVTATDGGGLHQTADVQIILNDTNDNIPIFNSSLYNESIREDHSVDSAVLSVQATDADSSSLFGSIVRYALTSTETYDMFPFEVDSQTGEIKLSKPVDYDGDATRIYNFTIQAWDGGNLSSNVSIQVHVIDVNDNPPCPKFLLLNASVVEHTLPQKPIITIDTVDLDSRKQHVRFQITNGGIFRITSAGNVFLRRRLDREKVESVMARVTTSDRRRQTCPERATLTVFVLDINDHSPVLSPTDVNLNIKENTPARSYAQFSVSDEDATSPYSAVDSFMITGKYSDFPFEVDESGSLNLVRPLDAEVDRNVISFTVTAIDGGGSSSNPATVTVTVENENEFAPRFSPHNEVVMLNENMPSGYLLITISATDQDTGADGIIVYSLYNPFVPFFINSTTGDVYTTRSFDYDTEEMLNFTVHIVATDGSNRNATTYFTVELVDINEHSPVFTEAEFIVMVDENVEVGRVVKNIVATDQDRSSLYGSIKYFITSSDEALPVALSQLGNLSISSNLDYEDGNNIYQFTVAAFDGGNLTSIPANVTLIVLNVNDETPYFINRHLNFSVNENEAGQIAALSANDRDGNLTTLSYHFVGEYPKFMLTLDGMLSPMSPLDAEEITIHYLQVVANDSAHISNILEITINVENVNDNYPVFEQSNYFVKVDEDDRFEFLIKASDSDLGELFGTISHYEILGDVPFNVIVNADRFGVLTNTERFDFEKDECLHQFEVTAYDNAGRSSEVPATISVQVINLNDNPPEFIGLSKTPTIEENTVTNITRVLILDTDFDEHNCTTDSDLQPLTYSVADSSSYDIFNDGTLYNVLSFDFETGLSVHELEIIVSDGNFTISVNVSISIQDINDHCPQITDDEATLRVPETFIANTEPLFIVNATDLDGSKQFSQIFFNVTADQSVPFEVNEVGEIWLVQSLDFERDSIKQYSFTVLAKDSSVGTTNTPVGGLICPAAAVDITALVINENDEIPFFSTLVYEFGVYENVTAGKMIGTLSFMDPDDPELTEHTYLFRTVPNVEGINISSDGELSFTDVLDFETQQIIEFDVYVSDEVHESSSPAKVTVNVLDLNEFSPVFLEPFEAFLAENTLADSLWFRVNATDGDGGIYGIIQNFTIVSPWDQYFSIDSNGILQNKVEFDFERDPNTIMLNIFAYDIEGRNSSARYIVRITDINDHSPVFDDDIYHVSLVENQNTSFLLQFSANDADGTTPNSMVTYYLEEISGLTDKFIINDLRELYTITSFDFEESSKFNLTVVATDGVFNAKAIVAVTMEDRNEFVPTFKQDFYQLSVGEDTPTGTALLMFTADDKDGGAVFGTVTNYMIVSSQPRRLPFQIVSNGTLYLTKKLDFENDPAKYDFSVIAVDGGGFVSSPVNVTVTIRNVHDKAPEFENSVYQVEIAENYVPPYPLLTFKVISEVSTLSFMIGGQNANSFVVDNNGSLFLVGAIGLDYETMQTITLSASVYDGFFNSTRPANIVINVLPVNDNPPMFDQSFYKVSFEENHPPSSQQLLVSLNDADVDNGTTLHGVIRRVRINDTLSPFVVDYSSSDNTVTISNFRSLDAEFDSAVYNLLLTAIDGGGATGQTLVQITINDLDDHSPTFLVSSYLANITENYVGSVLKFQAEDKDRDVDNVYISYTLGGEYADRFDVSENGELLCVQPFDYEAYHSLIVLTVLLENCSGLSCEANITLALLDQNDNSPIFNQTKWVFDLSQFSYPSVGQSLGEVYAEDNDRSSQFGSVSEYIIVSGDSGPFRVHSKTGVIFVSDTEYFELNVARNFTFSVVAIDGGEIQSSETATVAIHVPVINAFPPVISSRSYEVTVQENSFDFTLATLPTNAILQISVTDRDYGDNVFTYGMFGPSSLFSIDHHGYVYLLEPLDHEEDKEHVLSVWVTDGYYNSTFNANITVNVGNENDNRPSFNMTSYVFNVSEAYETFLVPVGHISAYDPDGELNQLQFVVNNRNSPFWINVDGDVFLRFSLNYEDTKQSYSSTVDLSDGQFASVTTAEVTVNVIDANDFRPEFTNSMYRVSINENLPPMSTVQIIRATDGDGSPKYSEIKEYRIFEDDVPFYIETQNRRTFVATNVSFDYEQDDRMYIFHVHAYDTGGLRSDVPAEIRVTIMDVNDCNPAFSMPFYSEEVSENEKAGTRVLRVTATDCDISARFRRIRYRLSNQARNLFRINSVSGVITTDRLFDYETNRRLFEFNVLVQDTSRGSYGFPVYVNVSITDVNEFTPQFNNLPASIIVPEGLQPNTTVYTVVATDEDAGPVFGNVAVYNIVERSPLEAPFEIDQSTGIVYLTSEIDYENGTREFNLTITASDEGGSFNTALLSITLSNINDERPLFHVTEYSVSIAENNYPASRIGWPDNALVQLQAEDPDGLELTFSFHSEDETLFDVTEDGYVVLKQPLDYERSISYSLQIMLNDSIYTAEEVATVNITVINENDVVPVFFRCLTGCCNDSDINLSVPLNISVRENTVGLMGFSIKACDFDNDPL